MYIRSADNTVLIRTILPAIDRNFPFHPSSLSFIWSINGFHSTLYDLPCFSGTPKCLTGRDTVLQPKMALTTCPARLVSPKCEMEVLWQFIPS